MSSGPGWESNSTSGKSDPPNGGPSVGLSALATLIIVGSAFLPWVANRSSDIDRPLDMLSMDGPGLAIAFGLALIASSIATVILMNGASRDAALGASVLGLGLLVWVAFEFPSAPLGQTELGAEAASIGFGAAVGLGGALLGVFATVLNWRQR